MQVNLKTLLAFLQDELDYLNINDIALNGLQVENSGKVTKIATAVDMSAALLEKVIEQKCDVIIVHHGWYWRDRFAITGRYYHQLKQLLQHDIALIAQHLPLDLHSGYGNNALLVKKLNLSYIENFGDYKGNRIFMLAKTQKPLSFADFTAEYEKNIGKPLALIAGGVHSISTVGICSGGGLFGIELAKQKGCDVFVTGDANHATYHLCKEIGMHLISGGHYNTEIWGVKALGELIATTYNVPHIFFDIPTNL